MLFVSTFAAAAVVAAIAYVSFGGRALIARGASERVLVNAVGNASGGSDTITGSGSGDSSKGGGKSSGGTAPHEGALNLERDSPCSDWRRLHSALGVRPRRRIHRTDRRGTSHPDLPCLRPRAVDKISWGGTVLLIGGIVTYVALLQNQNTVQWLGGDSVAHVGGIPLLAAFLICLIGAIVSAFASTTGILGALIPLAIPFLMTGQVNATGLVIALAISSSLVDCSPFSTNGALVVANAAPEERDVVFGLTMRWGMTIMVVTPILAWLLFVVPWSV